MWAGTNYNGAAISADFATLVGLGFNCARIGLEVSAYNATDAAGAFNIGTPLSTQLARLTDLCNRANSAGIQLQLCFFDLYGNYGQLAAAHTFLAAMLGAIVTSAVSVIELQNETPWGSTTAYAGGYDSGWTLSQTGISVGGAAITWAQALIPFIRSLVPGIPVVISANHYADLSAVVSGLTGSTAPSWYEYHSYPVSPGVLDADIKGAVALAPIGSLRIGETGATSVNTGTMSVTQAYQGQVDWMRTARWVCQKYGLGEPTLWAMYDNASGISNAYGADDESGKPRALVSYYQAYPTAGKPPGVNSSFSAPIADAFGNPIPSGWKTYKGNNGAQVISATYNANTITLVAPTNPGTDNAPGILTVPCGSAPLVGTTFSFSATLAGSAPGAYLQLNWYTSAAVWISNHNQAVTVTSTPTVFTVTGTIPATTAYIQIVISPGLTGGSLIISPVATKRSLSLAGTHRRFL